MTYGGFIMDAAAELGRNPVVTRFSLSMEMSRLTRDGTAEPVSRDQILRHARGQGNVHFPVQLTTSRIGNLTQLIHTLLYVMTIHIHIYITYILEGAEKRRAHINWSMVTQSKGRTRYWNYLEITGPVQAGSRQ